MEVVEFALLALGDTAHDALQGVLGGGNASVMSRLGIAIRFEDGDDRFCFMNVESEVRCYYWNVCIDFVRESAGWKDDGSKTRKR